MDSHSLDANSSSVVSGTWEDDPAAYRLHAKLDQGSIVTADVTDGISDDVDCVQVLVRVDEDGRLGIWNGSKCEQNQTSSEAE